VGATLSGMRPLIGLSTYREQASWGVWSGLAATLVPQPYLDGIVAGGGIPVLLPPAGGAVEAASAVARVDGLLLIGGPDIDPGRYGETPHGSTVDTRPERDAWELALLAAALDRDLPVLGVCRGAQLLNVALGGTLHQHLPEQLGHDAHRPEAAVFGTSQVMLDPGEEPGLSLGPATPVACYHHQAMGALGRDVLATGWSEDGLVEAIRVAGRAFVVGVQWHPEMDPDVRLWKAFVTAAGRAG